MKPIIILGCVLLVFGYFLTVSNAFPQDDIREERQVDDLYREARQTKKNAAKPIGQKIILLENEKTGQDLLLVPSIKTKRDAYPGEDDEERSRREAFAFADPGDDDEPSKREAYPYPYAQDDFL